MAVQNGLLLHRFSREKENLVYDNSIELEDGDEIAIELKVMLELERKPYEIKKLKS